MKKLYILIWCLLIAFHLSAQSSKKRKSPAAYNKQNKENEQFLEKQFWLGLKVGGNLASVPVEATYDIYSPIDGVEQSPKKYDSYKGISGQIGLEVSFYFKSFSISFQPTYQQSKFSYSKDYTWGAQPAEGEQPGDLLEMTYQHDHKVDHLLLPLLVKYELTGNKLRPYVEAGLYQGILLNADKSVTISGTDYASGGINEFEKEPIEVGATDLFAKYHWGLVGGAGVYYNLGNVRLNLDIQYRHALSTITSNENRYSNEMLVSAGDVMDDLRLNTISFSIGCLFPMRFLESGFKSLDRK
jgi:outer membrane protein W